MDWYEAAEKYDRQTWEQDGRLSSLPADWQRELAALWRLDRNVNNGAYLQFLVNCGRESYDYASRALKRMGARKTAEIIDTCQSLIDEHFLCEGKSGDELAVLLPNQIISREGKTIKEPGSVLPESVRDRISELSYEYMNYPEDFGPLAEGYFRPHLADN